MKIDMSHGSGGWGTQTLVEGIFKRYFSNPILDRMEDAAVLPVSFDRIAFTTDSFVVKPLFFSGGDIGRLAVCGTVNDLLMMGATPRYLTGAFIIEEGMELEQLEAIVASMRDAAAEAEVAVVAGDTKVVEGSGGLYINTGGIGTVRAGCGISASNIRPGDAVLLSGSLGNHHACILSHRMGIKNDIRSDCAPLVEMVERLMENGVRVKAMRDVTRGGLATVLNELSTGSGVSIRIEEDSIPVDEAVRGFCGILGLDPLYMGNEGKMVCIVAEDDRERALQLVRGSRYGENAAVIGKAEESVQPRVVMTTRLGGRRVLDVLRGEGLPRIC